MPQKVAKRVSRAECIWRVYGLKIAGVSDREIAQALAQDPSSPTTVSHQQVNKDWHDAMDALASENRAQGERLRTLAVARIER